MQCRRCKHNVMALTMMLIRCIINFINKKMCTGHERENNGNFPEFFLKKISVVVIFLFSTFLDFLCLLSTMNHFIQYKIEIQFVIQVFFSHTKQNFYYNMFF